MGKGTRFSMGLPTLLRPQFTHPHTATGALLPCISLVVTLTLCFLPHRPAFYHLLSRAAVCRLSLSVYDFTALHENLGVLALIIPDITCKS